MISPFDQEDKASAVALGDAMEILLSLGASMLRAGNTASLTREWMEIMARNMGCNAVSVSLTLDSAIVSVRHSGDYITAMREIGSPGINVWRIGELEQLAKTARPGISPREMAARLGAIESTPPRYSAIQLAAAVCFASGAFAFLNGAAVPEIILAGIAGAMGQRLRSSLSRRHFNHYGVAALSATVACGVYALAATLVNRSGLALVRNPAGFYSSALFLVPGFPLIAALFDLLQHQTVAAVSRFAHGAMILLAIVLGLSIVIELAGVDLSHQPPLAPVYPLKLLLRAAASFVASCAFAMLFNSPVRTVLAVGLLAVGANALRLVLSDMGMMLAPAAFFGALAVGFVALLVDRRLDIPRMAMTVPAIVIMVPGVYAFEMIVRFNRGQMLDALQAASSCGFVIGALAMGLAAARLFSRR